MATSSIWGEWTIKLGEIESILGEIEAIKQSVVMAHELRPGDTRLVAYFVPAAGRTITATEMRAYLRNKLPEYMIPQHFVEMERIPLTPSGKVARKELPSPLGIEGGVKIEYVPPSNEAERVLASIWQEVLGLDRVSAHDNFFDLGGHSLLCIQVIERIMKETGVRLSPRTILLNNLSQISQELNASLPSEETAGREEAAKKNADSSPGGFLRRMRRRFLPRSK
jgi:acyl carrier protein